MKMSNMSSRMSEKLQVKRLKITVKQESKHSEIYFSRETSIQTKIGDGILESYNHTAIVHSKFMIF